MFLFPRLKTKIALFFFTVLILFSSFSPFVLSIQAQTTPPTQPTWYYQNFDDWYNKVYGLQSAPTEIFGERYTAAQVEWVLYGFFAFVLNHLIDPRLLSGAMAVGRGLSTMADLAPVVLDILANLVDRITYVQDANPYYASLPNDNSVFDLFPRIASYRPLSGIGYLKDKLNIVPEVYAQEGFGFGALSTIRSFWVASRDVSYTLLIFIIVVMAFMIMFRVKLSPQMVISVQSALPKIIIATILITFSYPIAGFLVDLVYIVIGLLALMLERAGIAASVGYAYDFMVNGMPPFGGGALTLMFFYIEFFFVAFTLSLFANNGILLALPLGGINVIVSIIITLLLVIILIIATIKVLWTLVKALVAVYLLVIAGPFYILIGTVTPGFSFGSWVKDLLANLAVFPVTGLMFALAYAFLFTAATSILQSTVGAVPGVGGQIMDAINTFTTSVGMGAALTGGGWVPPLLALPGTGPGGTPSGILLCFVSLSIIMLIPKLGDIIKSLIQGRPFAYGTAIGEGVGSAAGAGMMGLGGASAWQQQSYAAYQKGRLPGSAPNVWQERVQAGANLIRGISGGKVR